MLSVAPPRGVTWAIMRRCALTAGTACYHYDHHDYDYDYADDDHYYYY